MKYNNLPVIGKGASNAQQSSSFQINGNDRRNSLEVFAHTSRSMSLVNNQYELANNENLNVSVTQQKANALENRIKRLVFEEQRAKKLTDIANEKAEKLLQARDRHQKELEDKLLREQLRMEKIEM